MPLPSESVLGQMMSRFARSGRVRWIGLRPQRGVPMREVAEARAVSGSGLQGDRFNGRDGARGVTLIQHEHLAVIASLAGVDAVHAAQLRRNLLVEGLPLVALIGRRFRIGAALFEATGRCDPCSRMEQALGRGGYNAMRGHGGITARVLEGDRIAIDDELVVLAPDTLATSETFAVS